jgi:hypothetical protein
VTASTSGTRNNIEKHSLRQKRANKPNIAQSLKSAKSIDSFLVLSVQGKRIISSMPREAELPNAEKAFILEALGQNIRLDGRALDQFRNLDLFFEDGYGICTVQLGKTKYASSRLRRVN